MAHSRRYGSPTRRGQRRLTSWQVGPETGVDGAGQFLSASSSVLATTGIVAALDGLTLIRIRGDLSLFLTAATSVLDGFHGAFGIGIASEPAFTAGVASVPTPITDETDENWLYHRYFSILAPAPIAAAASQDNDIIASVSGAMRVEVDSKAMRKFDNGQALYAAVEIIEVGVATMGWAFNCRTLVKLP